MLRRFKDYSDRQHLFPSGQEVLLAVSGGRDSVAMTDLMCRAAIPFAIAHCNFHLRGDESDRDSAFVRVLADRCGVPFHTIDFDTRAVAATTGESIEEVARRLRYDWFAQLCRDYGYPCVAVAHHRDDSIETFFLNLLRGTGLHGLHGIRPQSRLSTSGAQLTVVRPMLCFSRADIDDYVRRKHLDYVDDSTNLETEARRNYLRLRVLPLLREVYPAFDDTMQANIDRLADAGQIYDRYVDSLRAALVTEEPSRLPTFRFPLSTFRLDDIPEPRHTLLYELLRPYGFRPDTAADILAGRQRTGSRYLSSTHEAVVDRGRLVVAPIAESQPLDIVTEEIHTPGFPLSSLQILVDADSVVLPLTLRPWQPGDRFHPFGMEESRLVSDFLKDLKINRIEKHHVQLLIDAGGRIVWVVGLRADNRFRITDTTKHVLRLTVVL